MQSTEPSSSPDRAADARPVLVIAGPTASGKSALALAAAQRLDGVVINADSMQVYRRLRILTARPSPEDEAAAPHRLYGWLEPTEVCSAGRWRAAALAEIAAAHAAGRLPILCGGTGFYLQALMQGLPEAPEIPEAARDAARAEVAADARAAHARLAAADPKTAARIKPTDPQRLARAIEVWLATDAPPSAALGGSPNPPENLSFTKVLLAPDRDGLYGRINARAEAMAAAGAAEEATAFMAAGIDPNLPAAKAVGLREFARAADDEILLREAISATAQATRRYAKRQTTWFRHRFQSALFVEEQLNTNNMDYIVAKLPILPLT